VCETAHGSELLVDGVGGQPSGFQVHAVANDDDTVESEPRLGAVPGNKLVNGIFVDAACDPRLLSTPLCNDPDPVGEAFGDGNSARFCLCPWTAASHAAGLELRQTGWSSQVGH